MSDTSQTSFNTTSVYPSESFIGHTIPSSESLPSVARSTDSTVASLGESPLAELLGIPSPVDDVRAVENNVPSPPTQPSPQIVRTAYPEPPEELFKGQSATLDRCDEVMRYMRYLNECMEKDAHHRETELRSAVARIDQIIQPLPRLFEGVMEMLRENRLAQVAVVDQQREIMRYMRGLNEWLERDVHDRQSEIRGVVARIDQLSNDMRGMQIRDRRPPLSPSSNAPSGRKGDTEIGQLPAPFVTPMPQSMYPSGPPPPNFQPVPFAPAPMLSSPDPSHRTYPPVFPSNLWGMSTDDIISMPALSRTGPPESFGLTGSVYRPSGPQAFVQHPNESASASRYSYIPPAETSVASPPEVVTDAPSVMDYFAVPPSQAGPAIRSTERSTVEKVPDGTETDGRWLPPATHLPTVPGPAPLLIPVQNNGAWQWAHLPAVPPAGYNAQHYPHPYVQAQHPQYPHGPPHVPYPAPPSAPVNPNAAYPAYLNQTVHTNPSQSAITIIANQANIFLNQPTPPPAAQVAYAHQSLPSMAYMYPQGQLPPMAMAHPNYYYPHFQQGYYPPYPLQYPTTPSAMASTSQVDNNPISQHPPSQPANGGA